MTTFDIAASSRVGGRAENEDYADFLQLDEATCWVLADGLGGHRGGATASRTAVEAALASFRERRVVTAEAAAGHVTAAQQALLAAQEAQPALAQMRTTIVVLVSDGTRATWAHVGDSRLYQLHAGRVVARTKDHSVIQALVDAGAVAPADAGQHEDRARLLRSLGKGEDLAPTVQAPVAVERGDAFLLCSDGFWEVLDDTAIEIDLAGSASAAAWLERMEARVRRTAGEEKDNYSATTVRLAAAGPGPGGEVPTAPVAQRLGDARTVRLPGTASPPRASRGPWLVALIALVLVGAAATWQRHAIATLFGGAGARPATAAPPADRPQAAPPPITPGSSTPSTPLPAAPQHTPTQKVGTTAPEPAGTPVAGPGTGKPAASASTTTPANATATAAAPLAKPSAPAELAEGTVFLPKQGQRFARLEDAVHAAKSGDTIWIGRGRFMPILGAVASSLTFRGAGRDATLLDFSGQPGLVLQGASGGVEDLAICCSEVAGIELGAAFQGIVARSQVRDSRGWGIIIVRGASPHITDTPMSGNHLGDVTTTTPAARPGGRPH